MFSKKMITLLVLMIVMVAGAAMAGEDFEYKVYGKLHSSINMMNDSDNSQLSMSSNTSRFGIKGEKELNDNFTFIWQFENTLNMVNGTGTLTNRNTFLGLKGDWGMFLYGRHDTPFKTLGRKVTNFFDTVGDFRNMTMGWDRRVTDVAVYGTPDFDGFTALLAYRMDQNAMGADDAATGFSGMASYAKDALYVGVAFEALTGGNYMDDWDNDVNTPDTAGETASGFRGGVKYTTDDFVVTGLFQALSNINGVKDLKATTFGGEFLYNFDPKFAAKAGFYMTDPDTDTDDNEYNQLAIGLDHNYCKTVQFYLQYCMVMNGDAATQGVGNFNGFGDTIANAPAGESPSGISFGMVKKW